MRRIFIDSDIIQEDEVRTAQRTIYWILKDQGIDMENKEIFDAVLGRAWHQTEAAWAEVLKADEIYADTSLVPLAGYGTYTGSVVAMDKMMKMAIEQNITGKSVFFLRPVDDVEWDGIDLKLFAQTFKDNKLFCIDDRHDKFLPVDIKAIVKKYK